MVTVNERIDSESYLPGRTSAASVVGELTGRFRKISKQNLFKGFSDSVGLPQLMVCT